MGAIVPRSRPFIMDEKFEKTGPRCVSSTKGFVVEIQRFGGVLYRDAGGEVVIGTSWLGKPPGISLHPSTLSAKGLDQARIDLIIPRAVSALHTWARYDVANRSVSVNGSQVCAYYQDPYHCPKRGNRARDLAGSGPPVESRVEELASLLEGDSS
jgi:hypothetical protein